MPFAMGQYVENTGDEPLCFLETFRSDPFADVSLSQWLALTPPELVRTHLNLDPQTIAGLSRDKLIIVRWGAHSRVRRAHATDADGFEPMITDLLELGVPAPEKVVRSLLVFAFLVFALRVAGKRELAQLNVMDLAVLLLVSNTLQNAMIGNDNSLLGGIIGATTLFAANYWFVRLTYRSKRARRLLEGSPRTLLENGVPDRQALRKEAITQVELQAIAHERGFLGLEDVSRIVLETDGRLTVTGRGARTPDGA